MRSSTQRQGRSFFLILVFLSLALLLCLPLGKVKAEGNTLTVGNGGDYTTLKEAVEAAADGDTIEVVGDVVETEKVIFNKNVTLTGSGTVTFPADSFSNIIAFEIPAGKSVTFCGPSSGGELKLKFDYASVEGSLILQDGAKFFSEHETYHDKNIKVAESGTFTAEGGQVENIALWVRSDGQQGHTSFSGGTFTNTEHPCVYVFPGGVVDKVEGTASFSTTATSWNSVSTFMIDGGAVNTISGGEFKNNINYALYIKGSGEKQGKVGTISGGEFTCDGARDPKSIYGYTPIAAALDGKTRIDEISGGHFFSEARLSSGLWLGHEKGTSIGKISGGTFEGKRSGMWIQEKQEVELISGGTFRGETYGVLNGGNIGTISGGEFLAKKVGPVDPLDSVGLRNYDNGNPVVIGSGDAVGHIGKITGGRFEGKEGLLNDSIMGSVSGATFVGGRNAFLNDPDGVVEAIHSGVFRGNWSAIHNVDSNPALKLEPDLDREDGYICVYGDYDWYDGYYLKDGNKGFQLPAGYAMNQSRSNAIKVEGFGDLKFHRLRNYYYMRYAKNDGGRERTDPEKHKIGEAMTIQDNMFESPASKKFVGWSTEPDGIGGKSYKAGDKTDGFSDTFDDTILYAQWKDIFLVTFNVQEHGTAPETVGVEKGEKVTKPADPTDPGYTFAGWYTDQACTAPFDFDTPINEDVTLYAKWDEKPKATITLDPKDGHWSDGKAGAKTFTIVAGTAFTFPADVPVRDGYTFVSWQPDGHKPGASVKLMEDTTFTPKWEKNKPSGGDPGHQGGDTDQPTKTDLVLKVQDMTIYEGDAFDPMDMVTEARYATTTDPARKLELKDQVKVTGAYDPNRRGDYVLTFTLTAPGKTTTRATVVRSIPELPFPMRRPLAFSVSADQPAGGTVSAQATLHVLPRPSTPTPGGPGYPWTEIPGTDGSTGTPGATGPWFAPNPGSAQDEQDVGTKLIFGKSGKSHSSNPVTGDPGLTASLVAAACAAALGWKKKREDDK